MNVIKMKENFKIEFLEEAYEFLENVDEKARRKILFNAKKAQYVNDSNLFKKLSKHIWEFRTIYRNQSYRFLAFWNKNDKIETLVIITHGFVKKSQKTPTGEIIKAEGIRKKYFELNQKK